MLCSSQKKVVSAIWTHRPRVTRHRYDFEENEPSLKLRSPQGCLCTLKLGGRFRTQGIVGRLSLSLCTVVSAPHRRLTGPTTDRERTVLMSRSVLTPFDRRLRHIQLQSSLSKAGRIDPWCVSCPPAFPSRRAQVASLWLAALAGTWSNSAVQAH